MTKKNSFLFLLTFFGVLLTFAQKGSINGIIIDNDSNETVPFATIVLLNSNSLETVTGAISSDNGTFNIENIKYGTFNLQISFIGYQTVTIENIILNKSTQNTDVGRVLLKPQIESLNEMTINAKKRTATTKIDRKTYSVSDFETAKGGNAADVLNKLPSISVDPSGHVSVWDEYCAGKGSWHHRTDQCNSHQKTSVCYRQIITLLDHCFG